MDFAQLIADLRSERDRVQQAIDALEALAGTGTAVGTTPKASRPASGPRRMSVAARRRISEAAKKRWANVKGRKAAPTRGMSAAARKRLSALAKARWAKRKKEGKTRL
jgi:hypothetical protein